MHPAFLFLRGRKRGYVCKKDTLGTEMFGVGDFWLETKILLNNYQNFEPSLLTNKHLLVF